MYELGIAADPADHSSNTTRVKVTNAESAAVPPLPARTSALIRFQVFCPSFEAPSTP
jgi:hypothetical protein